MLYIRNTVPDVLYRTITSRYLSEACTNETDYRLSYDVKWFAKFYQCPSVGYTVDTMPVILLNKNETSTYSFDSS